MNNKPKKLVLFCDGTWNRVDQKTVDSRPCPTNVLKLFEATMPYDQQGNPQIVHYIEGVGTRRAERLRGGGFGYGISDNIKNAYCFIVSNYAPGDEIFLFGFSRGAFTVRSIAGMIRNVGILKRHKRHLANEAFRRYVARSKKWHPDSEYSKKFRKENTHQNETIRFLGVWDTVGALGAPFGILLGWVVGKLFNCRFHDVKLSSIIDSAYHALSIDERRWPFRPTLWKLNDKHLQRNAQNAATGRPPAYEEKWFPGVHSNVGGGYPNTGLSDCALEWMVDRARSHGLNVDIDLISNPQYQPDVKEHIEKSQTVVCRLATALFVKLPSLISSKLIYPKDRRSHVCFIKLHGDYVRPIGNPGNIKSATNQYPQVMNYQGDISMRTIEKLATDPSYQPQNVPLIDFPRVAELPIGNEIEIVVDPGNRYHPTGLLVTIGEQYRFEAHGMWKDASRICSPEGWSAWWTFLVKPWSRLPGKKFFYLCGNVNRDECTNFPIGSRAEKTMEIADGQLYMFANDLWYFYGNNRALPPEQDGPMKVKIRRIK